MDNVTIKRTGLNTREVTTHDRTILISFETPVAVRYTSGLVCRSNVRFSRTTEKHIRLFSAYRAEVTAQTTLDHMLEELCGSSRLPETESRIIRGYTGNNRQLADTTEIDYADHTNPGDAHLVVPVGQGYDPPKKRVAHGTYVIEPRRGGFSVQSVAPRMVQTTTIQGGEVVENKQTPYTELFRVSSDPSIFDADYSGDDYWEIDLDCGMQRWRGQKSSRDVRIALRKLGFSKDEVDAAIALGGQAQS